MLPPRISLKEVSVPLRGMGWERLQLFLSFLEIRLMSFRPLAGNWLGKSWIAFNSIANFDAYAFPSPCRELVGKAIGARGSNNPS